MYIFQSRGSIFKMNKLTLVYHLLLPQPIIHTPGLHIDPSRSSAIIVYCCVNNSKTIYFQPSVAYITSSWSRCVANGSRCSCSIYFSRLKNVSKKIGVVLQRFRSPSVTKPGFFGFTISSIWHKQSSNGNVSIPMDSIRCCCSS